MTVMKRWSVKVKNKNGILNELIIYAPNKEDAKMKVIWEAPISSEIYEPIEG